MDSVVELEDVRRVVVCTLGELGVEGVDQSALHETLLLCDQVQPGRRFQYDDVRAVWFPDRATVDFFSMDGEFIRAVAVQLGSRTTQAAA